MTDPPGVWVAFGWDNQPYVVSIHDNELDALRAAVDRSCLAKFIPFGVDFSEAIRWQGELPRG